MICLKAPASLPVLDFKVPFDPFQWEAVIHFTPPPLQLPSDLSSSHKPPEPKIPPPGDLSESCCPFSLFPALHNLALVPGRLGRALIRCHVLYGFFLVHSPFLPPSPAFSSSIQLPWISPDLAGWGSIESC